MKKTVIALLTLLLCLPWLGGCAVAERARGSIQEVIAEEEPLELGDYESYDKEVGLPLVDSEHADSADLARLVDRVNSEDYIYDWLEVDTAEMESRVANYYGDYGINYYQDLQGLAEANYFTLRNVILVEYYENTGNTYHVPTCFYTHDDHWYFWYGVGTGDRLE